MEHTNTSTEMEGDTTDLTSDLQTTSSVPESVDNTTFQKDLKMCLQKHRIKDLNAMFTDQIWQKMQEDIELMWDVNSLLFLRLRTLGRYRFCTFEACQRLLVRMAMECNPKELLIAFLAELENRNVEDFDSTDAAEENESNCGLEAPFRPNTLKALLEPMQVLMSRFGKDRASNLDWALASLYGELYRIPLPEDATQDELSNVPENERQEKEQSTDEDRVRPPQRSLTNHDTEDESEENEQNDCGDDEEDEEEDDENDDEDSSQLSSVYSGHTSDSESDQEVQNMNGSQKLSLQWFDFLLPDYVQFLSSHVQLYQHVPTEISNTSLESIKQLNESFPNELNHSPIRSIESTTSQNGSFASSNAQDSPNNGCQILLRALLSLLNFPLLYLNFNQSKRSSKLKNSSGSSELCDQYKGWTTSKEQLISHINGNPPWRLDLRKLSVKIAQLIARLEPNLFSFYAEPFWTSGQPNYLSNMQQEFGPGIGMLSYVAFVLQDKQSHFFVPQVYTPLFVFQANLPYINLLLGRSKPYAVEKALLLARRLLQDLNHVNLQERFRDLNVEQERVLLEKTLIKIMRYSNHVRLRRLALDVFKRLIDSLDNVGRYSRIYSILTERDQFCGVRSLMLTLYKNMLANEKDLTHLTGASLHQLVRFMCRLIKQDMQLISNVETVMTFLNLLRFLVLWDVRQDNRTGIWDIAVQLEDDFLQPLHKELQLRKQSYRMELKSVQERSRNQERDNSLLPNLDLSILAQSAGGNEEFKKMMAEALLPSNEIKAIQSAISNLDLVESVLVRVSEIITAAKS